MTTFSTFEDSSPVTADDVLSLEGLWIHEPEDAQGTSTKFRFGRDLRGFEMDVGGSEQVFAGRRYPVIDYGEHQKDSFSVGVQILNGPSYHDERQVLRDFIEAKKTLVFRDNRGHAVFGAVGNLSEDHESWGSSFKFTVVRVHREITEIN